MRAETLLSNRSSNTTGAQGNTLRLLRIFNYKKVSKHLKWDIEKLLNRWDKHINNFLHNFGGRILPSPQIDIDEIIQRSIARRKPFSKGDRGFRDTIIWLSTLGLVSSESRVSFITSNTQDFFQPNSVEPHPEILNEAQKKLDPNIKMLFHQSIEDLITAFDSDRSASAQALQHALISNTLSHFNLWNWLEENLMEVIGDEDFDAINWAGLPYHVETPTLVDIEDLVSIDIPRIFHLQNEVYRLYCDLAFIGHFDCDIGYAKAEIVVSPNQILWKDETDSFWTRVGIRAAATFILKIDFDVQNRTILNCMTFPLTHWNSYDEVIEKFDNSHEFIREEKSSQQ